MGTSCKLKCCANTISISGWILELEPYCVCLFQCDSSVALTFGLQRSLLPWIPLPFCFSSPFLPRSLSPCLCLPTPSVCAWRAGCGAWLLPSAPCEAKVERVIVQKWIKRYISFPKKRIKQSWGGKNPQLHTDVVHLNNFFAVCFHVRNPPAAADGCSGFVFTKAVGT